MLIVNKAFKLVTYFAVRLLSTLAVALLSVWTTAPVFLLYICMADRVNKIPALLQGRYLIAWLIASIPLFIVFSIYVEVTLKKEKKPENN